MNTQADFDKLAGRIKDSQLAGEVQAASTLATEALEACAWPKSSEPIPLVEDLSHTQRALAAALAPLTPLHMGEFAIPISARVRLRWLGISPPGPLEELQDFELSDGQFHWPLWRYLVDEDVDEDEKLELIAGLDQIRRLATLAELALESYDIDLDYEETLWTLLDQVDGQGADWAAAFADELLTLFESCPSIEANQYRKIIDDFKNLTIIPLARAGRTIEPRWEILVPLSKNKQRMEEIVTALRPERREAVLLARLEEAMAITALTVALDVLAYLPSAAIAKKAQAWLKDKDWERNLGRDRARAMRRRLKGILAANPALK